MGPGTTTINFGAAAAPGVTACAATAPCAAVGIVIVGGIVVYQAYDYFFDDDHIVLNEAPPQTGNTDIDTILGDSVPGDSGNFGYNTPGTKEDFEEAVRGLDGSIQRPTDTQSGPSTGTTTTLPDGTKVDTYPERGSTGLPGWSVTPPGSRKPSYKGSFQ